VPPEVASGHNAYDARAPPLPAALHHPIHTTAGHRPSPPGRRASAPRRPLLLRRDAVSRPGAQGMVPGLDPIPRDVFLVPGRR